MATKGNFPRAQGPATILAIGTATPPNIVDQTTYADYYFRVTNSDHKTQLKTKFKRICEKSMIRKRHMYLTEEILKQNPNICAYDAPSLDARQAMVVAEVPKLGNEAANNAIKEWARPKSNITHLIFCTSSGVDMPGADYQLTKLCGLNPSINRFMIYHQGCYAGASAIRLAKDLAENNRGARVLIVCSEVTAILFRGPCDEIDRLVGQALFGDGAAAVIVGSDPIPGLEEPIYEIVSAAQTIVGGSDGAIHGPVCEGGVKVRIGKDVPVHFANNVEEILGKAFKPLGGKSDWNEIFWVAHPGGPAILDRVEAVLGLDPDKLRASRHVLSEYGNLQSACVLFILDEMRKKSEEDGLKTTGEGLEWGVLFGFGPGLTVEIVVLKCSIKT